MTEYLLPQGPELGPYNPELLGLQTFKCAVCLEEIHVIKPGSSSGSNCINWNETCLLKLFGVQEISSRRLEEYPPETHFCEKCSLRNQSILNLWNQMDQLQKCLEELKLSVESDFKQSFSTDSPELLDRKDFLRHQIARSMKILPETISEEEAQNAGKDSSAEVPPEVLYPIVGLQTGGGISLKKDSHKEISLKREEGSRKNKSLKNKIKGRSGPKCYQNKRKLDKLKAQLLADVKGKEVKIRVLKIPQDLLTNVPVNVHSIPGYVPTRPRRFKSATYRKEREPESDIEILSEQDDFRAETEDSEGETEIETDLRTKERKRRTKKLKKNSIAEAGLVESSEPKKIKRPRKRYPPGTINRFYCKLPECGRTQGFNSKEQLEIHQKKVHEGITHPFECEECGKTFRLLTQYKVHIRGAHMGQFSFHCEFCGKGFNGRANLQKHRVSHTQERNYKCPDCPADFKTAHGRVLHIRYAHTGERPFTCDVCGKGFVSTTKLNNHLKCVHHREERPIICHICGKNFPIQGYLYMHMRTHEHEGALEGHYYKPKAKQKEREKGKKKPEEANQQEIKASEARVSEECNLRPEFPLEFPAKEEVSGKIEKSSNSPLDLHLQLPGLYNNSNPEYLRLHSFMGKPNNSSRLPPPFFISNFEENLPNFQ